MSDKTCVTCGKGVRYIVTCSDREHQHAGLHQPDDTCRDYVERTDSLEQVALDAAKKNCCFCDYWDGAKMEPACDPCFADRLRALGVEVPQ